jgi:glycosyltransferase
VVAAGWVPLDQALPQCDLVISHGGPGTVFTGMVHGVPQLCLPQTSDQFLNTDLLVAHGLALGLTPDQAATETVLDRVATLLRDESFRTASRAVADEITLMPTPAGLVPELEQLVATGSRSAMSGVGTNS